MTIVYKIQKHFQNVMLVGMASEISKKLHIQVCGSLKTQWNQGCQGGEGEGGMGGGDLMPPSPVICIKEPWAVVLKARSSQTTLAIRVYFLVYSSSSG